MLTHIPSVDPGVKFSQQARDSFFFANSQQSKCAEKLVIFMYDKGWNTQFTEFDIVEEGDVPLLMSLPQMRNLGFQFELTPEQAYLSCARIGMRKMVLKTAIGTHCMVHEPSTLQDSTSQEFLLATMITLSTARLL